MKPNALTLAPSHPGPPAARIAATLDALTSFIAESAELAAQEAVRESLTHLVSLHQTLQRNVAAVEAGGGWLDDLLMWLVGLFRFIAGGGALPDSDRLALAVQEILRLHPTVRAAVGGGVAGGGGDRRKVERNARYPTISSNPPQHPTTSSTPPPASAMAPKPTPPLRSLPQRGVAARHDTSNLYPASVSPANGNGASEGATGRGNDEGRRWSYPAQTLSRKPVSAVLRPSSAPAAPGGGGGGGAGAGAGVGAGAGAGAGGARERGVGVTVVSVRASSGASIHGTVGGIHIYLSLSVCVCVCGACGACGACACV